MLPYVDATNTQMTTVLVYWYVLVLALGGPLADRHNCAGQAATRTYVFSSIHAVIRSSLTSRSVADTNNMTCPI